MYLTATLQVVRIKCNCWLRDFQAKLVVCNHLFYTKNKQKKNPTLHD